MEELQSTEALDREILEDARKKAFKILKSADESVKASKAAWEGKLEGTLKKARKKYDEKAAEARREILARLPMDKRRIRSKTIDRFLNKAMEDFLGSLDRRSLLHILEKELAQRAALGSGESPGDLRKGELRYRGLSREECSALVSASFHGMTFRYIEDSLYTVPGAFPAIVIDFPHLRIIASADRAAQDLLLDKRAELAAALLGNLEELSPSGGRNG